MGKTNLTENLILKVTVYVNVKSEEFRARISFCKNKLFIIEAITRKPKIVNIHQENSPHSLVLSEIIFPLLLTKNSSALFANSIFLSCQKVLHLREIGQKETPLTPAVSRGRGYVYSPLESTIITWLTVYLDLLFYRFPNLAHNCCSPSAGKV